jgi:hypothetical protein
MPVLMIAFVGLAAAAGLWFALRFLARPLDWFFGLIWRPRSPGDRAEIARRVKELCEVGNVPEETAVMLAAREHEITEKELLDSMDAVSPAQLRAMLTGRFGSVFGFSWEKLFRRKGRRG